MPWPRSLPSAGRASGSCTRRPCKPGAAPEAPRAGPRCGEVVSGPGHASRQDGGMAEPSKWVQIAQANPDHSTWYVQRFRDMAAAGHDLVGEARLIDAMVPPGSRVLDAGCGPGRHGGYLAKAGHEVVGVDV